MARNHVFRIVFLAVTTATISVGLIGSAGADQGGPSEEATQSEVVSVDEGELSEADSDAAVVRNSGDEPEELADLRDSLMKSSAASGSTLLDSDTVAYEVSDDIAVAATSNLSVQNVTVTTDDERAVAEVETEAEDEAASPNVQGMGLAWEVKASDTFIIALSGKGEMEARHIKTRNNTPSGFDLMSMRRKAMGRGYEIGGTNWSVTGLYISAHAIDSDRQWVIDRWSSAPSGDTSGNCGTVDVSLGYGPLAMTFRDCDKSDIKWDASNPAYYAAYMTQGATFNGGDRETGFNNIIKFTTGKNVVFKYYQRLEMARYIYPASSCAQWDDDRTCS